MMYLFDGRQCVWCLELSLQELASWLLPTELGCLTVLPSFPLVVTLSLGPLSYY